ncbi:MAG: OsmC family protein [Vulcanimicrobiota bacterium]
MKYKFQTSYHWSGENRGHAEPEDGPQIAIAPPPIFKGPKGLWSPEDLFLASLETCFFLSLLFELKGSSIELLSYQSTASGTVERIDGGLCFSHVEICPRATIRGNLTDFENLVQKAHAACLVSRSVNTDVVLKHEVLVAST